MGDRLLARAQDHVRHLPYIYIYLSPQPAHNHGRAAAAAAPSLNSCTPNCSPSPHRCGEGAPDDITTIYVRALFWAIGLGLRLRLYRQAYRRHGLWSSIALICIGEVALLGALDHVVPRLRRRPLGPYQPRVPLGDHVPGTHCPK